MQEAGGRCAQQRSEVAGSDGCGPALALAGTAGRQARKAPWYTGGVTHAASVLAGPISARATTETAAALACEESLVEATVLLVARHGTVHVRAGPQSNSPPLSEPAPPGLRPCPAAPTGAAAAAPGTRLPAA